MPKIEKASDLGMPSDSLPGSAHEARVVRQVAHVTKSKFFLRRRDEAQASAGLINWSARRAALADADKVLLSQTHLWLRQIPGHCHPRQLCRHYPRVANALAQCWDDRGLCQRFLTDLLVDARGGRAGFPVCITDELHVLLRLRELTSSNDRFAERLRRALNTSVLKLAGFQTSEF
jgi:hypothetical protein